MYSAMMIRKRLSARFLIFQQHPLILSVKTEHRAGTAINNPYLAFRRRTEKMQTRKNRKNDETSYEKMLKLRRDLSRAVTLLELVKRREKIKREYVHLTIEVFEKRYQAKDFTGAILSELSMLKASRPAFTPIFQNHYTNQNWTHKAILKDEVTSTSFIVCTRLAPCHVYIVVFCHRSYHERRNDSTRNGSTNL